MRTIRNKDRQTIDGMKTYSTCVLLLFGGLNVLAAESILTEMKFVEARPGVQLKEQDFESQETLKKRGALLRLSPPPVKVTDRQFARVETGLFVPAEVKEKYRNPEIELPKLMSGYEITVAPIVEAETVNFTVRLVRREMEQPRKGQSGASVSFTTQEWYLSGACKYGQAMLLTPTWQPSAKRGWVVPRPAGGRKAYLYIRFSKDSTL